ncbi:16100_t:CDS:2 [Acaulospora colombiana]|uniref:16100_t:CDS:1 n=1 Tax=Acaulospora colombiana TaxID=27376 RepID=A0ACA9NZK8_9GLOM|nr:16100_t:CDS:2 [Acaulospora colombiana]
MTVRAFRPGSPVLHRARRALLQWSEYRGSRLSKDCLVPRAAGPEHMFWACLLPPLSSIKAPPGAEGTATLADTAQLAALVAATTGGTPQLASPPSAKKETLRSERMLRNMLAKDGVARSRSLSRGSSTAHHVPSSTRQPAPPLPNQQPQVYSPTPVPSNTLPRSPSGSGNSNASR